MGAQSQKINNIFIAVGAFQSSSAHVADTAMGVVCVGGVGSPETTHKPRVPAFHSLLTWKKWTQAWLRRREVIVRGEREGREVAHLAQRLL